MGLRQLYRGVVPPLMGVSLEKSLLFSSYNIVKNNMWIKGYNNVNNVINGMIAGLLTTFIVTPLERCKIMAQTNKINVGIVPVIKSIYTKEGLYGFGRGWSATLIREVPGYGIYMSMYPYLKNKIKDKNDGKFTSLDAWLIGGFTGVSSWIVIYPSDPIKSLMQYKNITLRNSAREIYNMYGWRGFYRGYCLGLIRAFGIHGGVFLGYELFDKLM